MAVAMTAASMPAMATTGVHRLPTGSHPQEVCDPLLRCASPLQQVSLLPVLKQWRAPERVFGSFNLLSGLMPLLASTVGQVSMELVRFLHPPCCPRGAMCLNHVG